MKEFDFLNSSIEHSYKRHASFIDHLLKSSLSDASIWLIETVEINPEKEKWIEASGLPIYLKDEGSLFTYSLLLTLIRDYLSNFRLSDFIHFILPTKCIVEIMFEEQVDNLFCKAYKDETGKIEVACPVNREKNIVSQYQNFFNSCKSFYISQSDKATNRQSTKLFKKSDVQNLSKNLKFQQAISFPDYLHDEAEKLANQLDWPILKSDLLHCLRNFWLGTHVLADETMFIHIPARGLLSRGVELTSGGMTIAAHRNLKLDHNEIQNMLTSFLQRSLIPIAIKKALEQFSQAMSSQPYGSAEKVSQADVNIIAQSPQMQEILKTVDKVAPTHATILLQGENGVGKELIAKKIHFQSPRQGKELVSVSCAAIPDTLVESEFFGHKKGAFTDARWDKDGLFKRANGSSLFLDEIGDTPLNTQRKLLRVLQEREFLPVGADKKDGLEKVDVRLIAATNKNLQEEMKNGRFREDLYYRINTIIITIPPLRERTADIIPIAMHYLKEFAERENRRIRGFSQEVLGIFRNYEWPGNVRELKNTVEHAVVICDGDIIDISCLPAVLHDIVKTSKKGQETSPNLERFVRHLSEVSPKYNDRLVASVLKKNMQGLKRILVSVRTSKNKCLDAEFLRKNREILHEIEFQMGRNIIKIPQELAPKDFRNVILDDQRVLGKSDDAGNLLILCDNLRDISKEMLYEVCFSQMLAEAVTKGTTAQSLVDEFPFGFVIENNILRSGGDMSLSAVLDRREFEDNEAIPVYLWLLYLLSCYVDIYNQVSAK